MLSHYPLVSLTLSTAAPQPVIPATQVTVRGRRRSPSDPHDGGDSEGTAVSGLSRPSNGGEGKGMDRPPPCDPREGGEETAAIRWTGGEGEGTGLSRRSPRWREVKATKGRGRREALVGVAEEGRSGGGDV
jgi:hypothetical protein